MDTYNITDEPILLISALVNEHFICISPSSRTYLTIKLLWPHVPFISFFTCWQLVFLIGGNHRLCIWLSIRNFYGGNLFQAAPSRGGSHAGADRIVGLCVGPDWPVCRSDFGRADGRCCLHQNCNDRVYLQLQVALLFCAKLRKVFQCFALNQPHEYRDRLRANHLILFLD